jgi:hypothetical protein
MSDQKTLNIAILSNEDTARAFTRAASLCLAREHEGLLVLLGRTDFQRLMHGRSRAALADFVGNEESGLRITVALAGFGHRSYVVTGSRCHGEATRHRQIS